MQPANNATANISIQNSVPCYYTLAMHGVNTVTSFSLH